MYLTASDDFEQIDWPAATDAGLTWTWDSAHCPRPISPLAADGVEAWYGAAFGGPFHSVNGYSYMVEPELGGLGGGEGMPMADVSRVWEQERLPVIQDTVGSIRDTAYEPMTAAELANSLPDVMRRSADAFALTIQTSGEIVPALTEYLTFCGMRWGAEGPVRGMRMIQGYPNATTASAQALQEVAAPAADSPALRATLDGGDLEQLRRADGGREVAEAFDAYLAMYGWRLPSWMQLEKPTWVEDPSIAMRLAAGYLDDGAAGPDEALATAAAAREEEIAAAEAELEGDDLAAFRRVREGAKDYVALIEGRALWQQQLFGVLRVPTMVLGGKLVEAGVLPGTDDVYYLTLDELKAAASTPGQSLAETVRSRRASLERWGKLIPPAFLGKKPEGRPEIGHVLMGGAGLLPDSDRRIVNGFGASPGVVQGTARVVLDIADLHRVGPGDILVTVFTAPTWSPAFGIAGAVVTDSGGVLSHAAIAAREYALPAVVGTQVGTAKIPDGATVTVDGAKGIVRIER